MRSDRLRKLEDRAFARELFRGAALRGAVDELEMILPYADPAEPWERYGITPLMLAAMEHCSDAVAFLAEIGGADIQDSHKGMNALMWSITQKDEPSARLLADFTDLNAKNAAGQTAADLATMARLPELAEHLRNLAQARQERDAIADACGGASNGKKNGGRL